MLEINPQFEAPTTLPDIASFLVWQYEQCPNTNRVHIQGFIHTKKAVRLTAMMKALNLTPTKTMKQCWFAEPSKGTDEENQTYCTKEETRMEDTEPVVLGKPSKGQGTRTDLASACALIKEGGIKHVLDAMPEVYVKYPRGMRDLHAHHHSRHRDRSVAPIVVCMFGPTGTGKTKRAHEWLEATGEPFYIKDSDNKWWDGYDNEKYVLIDEVVGTGLTLHEMLKILDRYALSREIKGGTIRLAANRFIITSNLNPREWFINATLEHKTSLLRRLTHIIEVYALDQEIENPFTVSVEHSTA